MQQDVYVSITGLRVRRVRHIPLFWWHATRSMAQARKAPGNISAQARRILGVHHTLSVWTDRNALTRMLKARRYYRLVDVAPHLDAMRVFQRSRRERLWDFLQMSLLTGQRFMKSGTHAGASFDA